MTPSLRRIVDAKAILAPRDALVLRHFLPSVGNDAALSTRLGGKRFKGLTFLKGHGFHGAFIAKRTRRLGLKRTGRGAL